MKSKGLALLGAPVFSLYKWRLYVVSWFTTGRRHSDGFFGSRQARPLKPQATPNNSLQGGTWRHFQTVQATPGETAGKDGPSRNAGQAHASHTG